jgi:teichuronic acid biosynthesis glycosyltransferase TuaC
MVWHPALSGYTPSMLRVLALTSRFPDRGRPGLGSFVERQYRELASRTGVAVEVVAPIGLPPFPLSLRPRYRGLRALPADESWRGLRVHRPRFSYPPALPQYLPQAMFRSLRSRLHALRRVFPFDLVAAEFFWPEGPAAWMLANAFAVPCSIKARGDDFTRRANEPSTKRLVLEAGRCASGMLAVSAAMRDSMVGHGLPEDRIAVHHTGVDRLLFRPGDGRAGKAALKIEGRLLLSVGNLIPRKRQALAIDALARIDGATLVVVGDGPERDRLRGHADSLGLGSRLRMLGQVPQTLMPALFNAADVTLHTARAEGLSNVWIESLACGTPVVTTDSGGAREAISRPEAGRIVASEPEAIADAVREVIAARADRETVAGTVEDFSWTRNASELEAHFRSIVGRAAAGDRR